MSKNIYRTNEGEDPRNFNRATTFFGRAGMDIMAKDLKQSDKVEYLNRGQEQA